MDAKEKAKELVKKFRGTMTGPGIEANDRNAPVAAKLCAEYIIEELPDTICGYMPEGGTAMEIDNFRKHWWKEVKEEIQKL